MASWLLGKGHWSELEQEMVALLKEHVWAVTRVKMERQRERWEDAYEVVGDGRWVSEGDYR